MMDLEIKELGAGKHSGTTYRVWVSSKTARVNVVKYYCGAKQKAWEFTWDLRPASYEKTFPKYVYNYIETLENKVKRFAVMIEHGLKDNPEDYTGAALTELLKGTEVLEFDKWFLIQYGEDYNKTRFWNDGDVANWYAKEFSISYAEALGYERNDEEAWSRYYKRWEEANK